MARTTSPDTLKKIEYVQSLHSENAKLTRRDLNEEVKKKFGTGLAFGLMANVLGGGRRRKRRRGGAASAAGATAVVAKRGPGRPPGSGRGPGRPPGSGRGPGRPPGSGRRGGRRAGGRMASVTDRVFSSRPAYLIVVEGGDGLKVRALEGKSGVKDEIVRLVESGVSPTSISVYSRDSFTVQTHPIVNLD